MRTPILLGPGQMRNLSRVYRLDIVWPIKSTQRQCHCSAPAVMYGGLMRQVPQYIISQKDALSQDPLTF